MCDECGGKRLQAGEPGREGRGIHASTEITARSIGAANVLFQDIALTDTEKKIAEQIMKEIRARLKFLTDVGIDYITLDRAAGTLSGGESQRIRLATQIGSSLTGVLYVLDEPSIGLHQRDNRKLLATLKRLRDLGNTVIVVEHDEDTIREADYVVDLGPGAGLHGGYVVAAGTPDEIEADPKSLTGRYLAGERFIPVPATRREPADFIEIKGARENNLKKIDAKFPLGVFMRGDRRVRLGEIDPGHRHTLQGAVVAGDEVEGVPGQVR